MLIFRVYLHWVVQRCPAPPTQTACSLSALSERREKLAVAMTRWTEECKDLLTWRLSFPFWVAESRNFWNQASGWTLLTSPWGGTFTIRHLGTTAAAPAAFWTTLVHDLNLLRQCCEQWSRISCIFQRLSQSVASLTLCYRVFLLFPVGQTSRSVR